ncbi:MAG: peptidoglycan-binding protein [Clostridia bacterium]|nr:peptidoglycan-binding protein [Clostridia bacterium]MBO5316482.1 peptidoglycan-binding protein [Clostridia bacterium]
MAFEPIIPEEIVIHLGSPDSDAMNVTESFASYIKNVASSEIYPTWPEQALRANILAQISVALNRFYTGFYRNRGYNFDITNSPAYDQTYVYQREIYSNISQLVDEIFNSYIRRDGNIEPLFAEFCDGVEVSCNGLEQWGSVRLAEEGLDYFSILQRYYGNDISIVENVPVGDTPALAPSVTLGIGDSGFEVELIQRRLNRISANFPGIPKIYPVDGIFGSSTENSVRKFQEVFNLTPDGLVGRATWNRIQAIYNAVKKLYTVSSEGLTVEDITSRYTGELSSGATGDGVLTIQYYLSYIALFVQSVLSAGFDGSFGPITEASVRSFQKTYGLPETGAVNRETFNKIESVYQSFIAEIDYEFYSGRILPFPGRILRPGTEGNDVRALQEYLNFIAESYPEIPKVNVDGIFGSATAEQVRVFKEIFNLTGEPDRVSAATWNAVTSVYDDLYTGNRAASGQYPGYDIS